MRCWRRPVTISYTRPQHLPRTVDEECRWRAWHGEHRRHFCLSIEQVWKRQAVLGDIGFHKVRRFSHIDAQHHESLVFVTLIERLESGPLSQTMGSPCGPKIHEHHLPFERP
jgi:hypothetical protein